ncbi:hypothetical protein Hydth_0698 [Hydrogenobacter thermophilus TK-6]|nr:hypothetical protein [Hydrogenobacter thermophilus]ADO45096.1 hypothetical protein Hydth_0698 [Hydrogenobacter thermophilus TK-6]
MGYRKIKDDKALAVAISLFAIVLITYLITIIVAYVMTNHR